MLAKLLDLRSFAVIRASAELRRAPASTGARSIIFANSEAGYVTIHVTNSAARMRHTGSGMLLASKKPSFGQDLVEAMKLVLAHHRGEIQLEQVLPKPRVPARKPRTLSAK